MNINQLKYFVELYRVRNFSKAAENLSISQPALSLQIQKVEEEFGYFLVERNRKPLGITAEGELFFEKAVQVIQMMNDFEQLSFELEEEIKGEIRIGIIPTLSPYLTPLIINPAKKRFPDLKIEIVELVTETILTKLKFNELDAGIISTPVKAANFGFTPLFYEQFFLYVAESHPLYKQPRIKQHEIATDELWYLTEGNCFQNQINSVCAIPSFESVSSSFRYVSSSIESLKRIVESQGGITFIPELATLNVSSEYEDLIKPFEDPIPTREISLVYLKNTGLKKLVRAFMEVILGTIPKRMKERPAFPSLDTRL
ncbi:hydrogen peroxide-inducible genes activator [uncultured Sunxiuqinia sp.]|uniref:hydrogen peroxide-inducible genes activator n=1 Tax=uncultured Sunxiuqinia sp. TaxID=1573825 RepID=UPI0030DC0DF3|tara:strand:+ start:12537 stop:13478 length:942 start_codon:yes stop_codon:yes gene_type:complete